MDQSTTQFMMLAVYFLCALVGTALFFYIGRYILRIDDIIRELREIKEKYPDK